MLMGYKDTLLSPIKIGNRLSQNRIFMQSMNALMLTGGNPTDTTYKRYEDIFESGGGTVALEAITRFRLNLGALESARNFAPERETAKSFRP